MEEEVSKILALYALLALLFLYANKKPYPDFISDGKTRYEVISMITLTDDEVALIRSLLTALRSIKVRDIDKALVILSKNNQSQ